MKKYEDLEKSPMELTDEETVELVKEIAQQEYARRQEFKCVQTWEDGMQEFLTYALERDKKGKTGLNSMKSKSMKHFKNIVHFEIRNGINYIERKKPVQRAMYNTYSLNQIVEGNDDTSGARHLQDIIPDEKAMRETEINTELDYILKRIDSTEDGKVIIKYGIGDEECTLPYSYRNMASLYFNLSDNKKLNYKDLRGLLVDRETGNELDDNQIRVKMNSFKNYIKNNNILGGIA